VVIGIITILIAMLMPALTAARRHAQTLQCGANLHSIGHAMQQYANEYKGRIPRDYWYDDQYKAGHILWAEAFAKYLGYTIPDVPDISPARDAKLYPYFANIPIYQCPAHPIDKQVLDYVSNAWYPDVPGLSAPLINVTRMRQSGRTVYLTEVTASKLQPTDSFGVHDVYLDTQLPVLPSGQPQPSSRVLTDKRHGGRINLLFLDGHVENRHFKEVSRADFDWLFN
jgi:prepilin-type processing-associated H-X9-DG protein